ncbi:group I truncated hemoglobin [Rhodocyclaceae bacterium SMB388]
MVSLYDRLGGASAVDAAVDLFYAKVLADARIRHLFMNTDIDLLRRHQKDFLMLAVGGASAYDGRSMRAAHQALVDTRGLDETHFDAVVENLAEALTELGIEEALIDEVADIAASINDDVLCR